ncbi:M15 family metallopeptidase [Streptomyces bohaiensis]|uniref:M15 family metallopeptidase n=1 Tax=Streptomyces bohaiensis TaxID=1431344 RepID=A0ABX1CA24_9ACTN|nr:M15 family metallopeptidase [Streptomyces bohaiensis]NJQ14928.1 M15 family metallopeptidase [Streptomyces bohaiensis]
MSEIILMSDPRVAAIELHENGEPLVDARVDGPALLVDARGSADHPAVAHLRTGVLERLLDAASRLPDGLRLVLVEGYRSPDRQRRAVEGHRERLRAEGGQRSEEELDAAVSHCAAPPAVAGHPAGAAADLTLFDVDGRELDMGTAVGATPGESDGACCTDALSITPRARENRRLMGDVLRAAGLVNYPAQWWHWSYGDRYWALQTGAPHAVYGPHER